jgi:hypothetical protein
MTAVQIKHKVNHVSLVVDKSGSMHKHQEQLIRVVDEFVKGLQEESDRLGHETRISLYAFDHEVKNLVWDMDVKHLPSLRGLYKVDSGATALIEAAVKSLDDLKNIWEEYGEHSFLQVVVTDGEENASGCSESGQMHTQMGGGRGKAVLGTWIDRIHGAMAKLPDHWTSAILVPNSLAKRTAQEYGFPAGNIAIWDADSSKGVEEAIGTVKSAATSFLRGREQGVRGTRNLFSTGADAVNANTVASADLVAIKPSEYKLVPVPRDSVIKEFVESCGYKYMIGKAFYQLSKTENIQATKEVAVVEIATDQVYTGADARSLIGLPAMNVRVKPDQNPLYRVFVQSTSVNRKLLAGTKLLIMN